MLTLKRFMKKLGNQYGEDAVNEANRWMANSENVLKPYGLTANESIYVEVLVMCGYALFDKFIEKGWRTTLLNNLLMVKSSNQDFQVSYQNLRLTQFRNMAEFVFQLTKVMDEGEMPLEKRIKVTDELLKESYRLGILEESMVFKGYWCQTVKRIRSENKKVNGISQEMQNLIQDMMKM